MKKIILLAMLVGTGNSLVGMERTVKKAKLESPEEIKITSLIIAAGNGDAKAQYELGVYYELEAKKDLISKVTGLPKPIDLENVVFSDIDYGTIDLSNVAGYQEAFKWYEQAAKKGHARALCNLGLCYELGKGIKKDFKKSFEYYQQAAAKGDKTARRRLGACYQFGLGTKKDLNKAKEYYQDSKEESWLDSIPTDVVAYIFKLAIKDNPKQYFNLIKVIPNFALYQEEDLVDCYAGSEKANRIRNLEQNPDDVIYFGNQLKLAKQGDVSAQSNLGVCYCCGKGVEKDLGKAFELFKKAAGQGFYPAQFNLGNCYWNGDGVEQNFKKAFEWYKKTADQGDAQAQDRVSVCYYSGRGVEKDLGKAFEWVKKAADQGYAKAQFGLSFYYGSGCGIEKDPRKSFEWLQKAADQGFPQAQCGLGSYYQDGYGIEKDLDKSFEWYKKAADQGFPQAKKALERLAKDQDPNKN